MKGTMVVCRYIVSLCAACINRERYRTVFNMRYLVVYTNSHIPHLFFVRQGLDKQETVNKYGIDQVTIWRRSYDIPPPACDAGSPHAPKNDPKYAGNPEACKIMTESLATTLERVLPVWNDEIGPLIKSGKRVIIAAHGNSLRALVMHLDNIPKDTIVGLNIPTGVPLVYELDENLRPIPQKEAFAPLQGRYMGNQDEIRARIEGVKNQTK